MEETRKYIAKSLEDQVCEENRLASESLEQYARHQGWIEEDELKDEIPVAIESTEEQVEDYVKEDDDAPMSLKVIDRGLYVIAGAIVFLALVYLGTYIHSVVSVEKAPVVQDPGFLYHYESERLPYHNEDIQFQIMPYELEEYLIRQLMGF